MPLAAIAGIVSGVATVAGAAMSANATNNATKAAAKAAADSNELEKEIYDRNSANLTPYSDVGLGAGKELSGLYGLGGDPAASKSAFDTFLGSTGYQFTLNQGLKSLSTLKATAGALDSGATLKAISDYGQNTALSYLNSYTGGLTDLLKTGETAAGALATNGQAYADSVSKTNQAASQQAETAAAQTNKDTGDALGGLSKLLTSGISAFGLGRGQSSYSAPASQDPVHIGPTDMDLIPHTIMTT